MKLSHYAALALCLVSAGGSTSFAAADSSMKPAIYRAGDGTIRFQKVQMSQCNNARYACYQVCAQQINAGYQCANYDTACQNGRNQALTNCMNSCNAAIPCG